MALAPLEFFAYELNASSALVGRRRSSLVTSYTCTPPLPTLMSPTVLHVAPGGVMPPPRSSVASR